MEYCTKKSSAEVQRDSADLTRKELEKLHLTLKQNPHLLKPESDDEEDDPQGYARRNHYLTLELNNVMLENTKLKNSTEACLVFTGIIQFMGEFHHLSPCPRTIDINVIIALKNEQARKTKRLAFLKGKLDGIDQEENAVIRSYFTRELDRVETGLTRYYRDNIARIENYIRYYQNGRLCLVICLSAFVMYVYQWSNALGPGPGLLSN